MTQGVVDMGLVFAQACGNINALEEMGTVTQPLSVFPFGILQTIFTINVKLQLRLLLGVSILIVVNGHSFLQASLQPVDGLGSHGSTGYGSRGNHIVGTHTAHMDDVAVINRGKRLILRVACR